MRVDVIKFTYYLQHGHEFYILSVETATQFGGYNPFDPDAADLVKVMNTRNPLRKDTVYVPPRGFAILQFPLNNDGLWLFHCHVLLHQAAGMGMVFHIGDIDPEARNSSSNLCIG
jgi:FtsP/CotA-like multicopper oxidase with cupredoxin domain